MSSHAHAAPVRMRFFTRGTWVLVALMALGLVFGLLRFVRGIGAIANLDNQWPWGIWIAIDIACGVALAAGGFTSAALAHVFHRDKFEPIVRPALITAMLGYTVVVIGLLADLGRYYNVWHPVVPFMWSGHSVLFEVGICVMFYLTVLYIEFLPMVSERFRGRVALPGALRPLNGLCEGLLRLFDRTLGRVMSVFIIAGVVLSCMHQSSLGALMVIASYKMHPLWWSPVLPLLFLLSAFCVGPSMVIFESMLASRAFGRRPEMEVLAPLSKIIPVLLFFFISTKAMDLAVRGQLHRLADGSWQSIVFMFEMGVGFVLPFLMFFSSRVRRSPRLLFTAATLVIFGVVMNRIDVFLVAYRPVYMGRHYFPAFGELAVTTGLVAFLIFAYRFIVLNFPVMHAEGAASPDGREAPHA
jgi:Ni/Fe-hydrogenase subunit HybB-like protein